MAGSDSSFLDHSYQNLSLTGFHFAFDLEGDGPEIASLTNFNTETNHELLQGELEFLGRKRVHFWKYLTPVLLFCAVLSAIFMMKNQNSMAAQMQVNKASIEQVTILTAPMNTAPKMKIAAIEKLPEKKEQEEEQNSQCNN